MANKNRAPATVRNILELLRQIINYGVRKQLCGSLGFKIEMPTVNNIKIEDLTSDQLKDLLDSKDKVMEIWDNLKTSFMVVAGCPIFSSLPLRLLA